MLADRPRLCGAIKISALLAVVGLMCFAVQVPVEMHVEAAAVPESPPVVASVAPSVRNSDTLIVTLRDVPEWTGVEEESDWAKSYRMIWDGPIQTWTTMRDIRVPSLNHRMIESIEPIRERCGTPSPSSRVIVVKLRVMVPGDLEAALEWVRSNPDVERADVR